MRTTRNQLMEILRTAQNMFSGICVNLDIRMTNTNRHKIHNAIYTMELTVKTCVFVDTYPVIYCCDYMLIIFSGVVQ